MSLALTICVAALISAALLVAWLSARRRVLDVANWLDVVSDPELAADPAAELRLLERVAHECGASRVALVLRRDGVNATIAEHGVASPGAVTVTRTIGASGCVMLQFEKHPSPAREKRAKVLAASLGPHLQRRAAEEEARRVAEEARRSAQATAHLSRHHDAVLEVLPDGFAVTDELGEIIQVNAAGREIVGIDDAPRSRVSLADVTNPLVQALREGTTASGLEVAIPGENGPRIVQVKLSKLSADPNSRAAVALFRDVTRELLLEHDLRKRSTELARNVAELERVTRLKSEFLASMSHELRTPLNAVIGFTEVLLDGTYGPLNDKQQACAADVLAGGRHLLGLINDILDLSKIEAGRMELQIEDLDAAEIASQAITFVRPQAAAKAIQIDLTIAPGTMIVRADADRLRQIFVNLLSNAVKFTPKNGRVSVLGEIRPDAARLTVVDTGIGIAEADRPKLFAEFSQVDGSITRKYGGTGLGLAICKRFVELQGGTIDFESELGVGSRFFFTVPFAARALRPTFNATTPLRRLSSRHAIKRELLSAPAVLVLDSDAAASRLCQTVLGEAGIPAIAVGSLKDAKQVAGAEKFEVLVIDPNLADATVRVANAWAAERFGPGVVVLSTLTAREATSGLGVAGFVQKPLDRAALVDKIRAAQQRVKGPRSALVVDANEDDRNAISALLEKEGFRVSTAATLAEARAAVAERRELVVLDLDLPDGDGKTLLDDLASVVDCASVVLTDRALDQGELADLERLCSLVLRKGTLSRSAFARHITSLSRRGQPRRQRVLAVDDNEQNLRLISAVLSRRGFEIIEARDAASAIRIARAELPDVILMDVMLPDVDGLSATRELKRDALTQTIPVIAVTAQAMAGDEERARDAGCTAYVSKPIEATRLLHAIEGAIRPVAA